MAYTTIDNPVEYFNTKLWTGNGSTQSITGVGFQPDWVWIKKRSGGTARSHQLYDVIRAATNYLHSDSTGAEGTFANGLTAFNSDGFSIGDNDGVNGNTFTYVGWNWLANGTGVSNTAGTISSTVSANTTAGFSIVSYTGNGSNGATIGHGLGATPSFLIVKNRTAAESWQIYSSAISGMASGYLQFDTSGFTSGNTTVWSGTSPTSSVFSVGTNGVTNTNTQNYIAYCFADVKGFSKFGGYTGNGSADGTFIYTGFKPAFVMIKNSSSSNDWMMFDSVRNTYNATNLYLQPNNNTTEASGIGDGLDFLSNGFKIRSTNGTVNTSGNTYIYMSFASNPFVTSGGIPVTAR